MQRAKFPEYFVLLGSGAGWFLALVWIYMLVWAICLVGEIWGHLNECDLWSWSLPVISCVPVVVIPIYFGRCVRRKQGPQFKPWFPWVVRIVCVSLILAVCDSWIAGTHRREPMFSHTNAAMADGGTRQSVGFGYCLTYHRSMNGLHGPEVWFWFTPFTVGLTTEHVGIRWLGLN